MKTLISTYSSIPKLGRYRCATTNHITAIQCNKRYNNNNHHHHQNYHAGDHSLGNPIVLGVYNQPKTRHPVMFFSKMITTASSDDNTTGLALSSWTFSTTTTRSSSSSSGSSNSTHTTTTTNHDTTCEESTNTVVPKVLSPSSRHHTKFMNPIVRQLWEQRQQLTANAMHSHEKLKDTTSSSSREYRHPFDSKTSIDYNFKTDEYLREAYMSPGGTMRFGKVLEDLDALAGNVAFGHVMGDENVMLVTAAVDRIALRDIPELDRNQRLTGQITYVGSSSMEIRMQIHELWEDGKDHHQGQGYVQGQGQSREDGDVPHHDCWLEAYFTFVAVDPNTNKPIKICPLVPETSEERVLFELGALKAAKKKETRKKTTGVGVGKPVTEEALQMERRAKQLLQDAFPLIRMPSLADPHSILMSHTQMQNTMIAQPQVRNLSNKIFGGFLMRRAFELAFSNAYSFGGEWPQMLEVDNITFNAPVNVGDLLQFNSRVIYSLPDGGKLDEVKRHSSKPLIMIEVECYVMEPEITRAYLSNRFYFTFVLPTKGSCRKVLPGTLEEARRMVERMVADESGVGKGYLRQYDFVSK